MMPPKTVLIDDFFAQAKKKSDKTINYFLPCFFIAGLGIAPFYDTWSVALGVGGLSLLAYYSTKNLMPKSNTYQYVLSAVLGIFMAQYIYQMHGLFEMHFIAFIGSALLITYQNWKLQIPLTLVVVLHHAIFGYMQYIGFDKIYFTQLDYMTLQTFIIHATLAAVIFFICGLWSYHFKKYSEVREALNQNLEHQIEERTAAMEQLEQVNNELESFSYTVSHDLRAPLRIINGYGKMLLSKCKSKLENGEQQLIADMMANAAQMGRLIDDLLNFSRMGRAQIAMAPVNMNDGVKSVINELRPKEAYPSAEIKVNDLGQSSCDPTLVKQVWANLISNALKYSGKKTNPRVEIGAEKRNGSTIYYVKDNGAGFDMEHSGKLFGVFQRLHKVTEYEGTGVGLAIVHRIITKHGGKIWADGKVDEGATFYFTLSQ